jgi:hypothetical protein
MPIGRRLIAVLCGVVALIATGCRLDMDIAVVVNGDGSGEVTVRAVASAEVIRAAPAVIESLAVDDLTERGWMVDGPRVAEDGSATVTFTATFDDAAGLATRLGDIGPPIAAARATRTLNEDRTRADNTVSVDLGVVDGFAAFADAELVNLLGGQPFADDLADVDPATALDITLTMTLPGSISDTDGTVDTATAVVTWDVPADGSATTANLSSVQDTSINPGAMATVADVLGVVLVLWVVASAGFIGWVVLARRQRATAR